MNICRASICFLVLAFGAFGDRVDAQSDKTADSAKHRTWAERLGYPAGKRVLMLHADDIGMCFEANDAAKKYLAAGHIQSAAAMVPCPWFDDFAIWAKERPELDVGLHLTLTSEWKHYRWGPTLPRAEVKGLVDEDGYLWRRVRDVALNASAEEVEREIRAQVERALSRGLRPGHIDTHMGTLYARSDYTAAYLKIAAEYRIPAMVVEPTPRVIAETRAQGYPMDDRMIAVVRAYPLPKLDAFASVQRGKTYEEVREKFFALVDSLEPGITEIIFHPSTLSDGLRAITGSWQQRAWEAEMFADPVVKKGLADRGVVFTDWREMMKRYDARPELHQNSPPPKTEAKR